MTEPGLEPAAILSERLDTPGTPLSVTMRMRNKLLMRRTLERRAPHLNVAYADPNDEDAATRLFERRRPVVIKPVAGTASAGVRLLHSLEQLRSCPDRRGCILEAYVDGPELSVEAFSSNGQHEVVGIALQEKSSLNGFVEVTHIMPPVGLSGPQAALVRGTVVDLLDVLGLRDGPTHTEVRLSEEGVKVIETHNRPAGDGIATLVAMTSGVDWRLGVGRLAVGREAGRRRWPRDRRGHHVLHRRTG